MTFREYRRRAESVVYAIRLDLQTKGFDYVKWGGVQHCKPGDWIVDNSGEIYTVDAESFARSYASLGGPRYQKLSHVWAERANQAGEVTTREGATHYEAGDYVVYNDPALTDGYAVQCDVFERLYEPVES